MKRFLGGSLLALALQLLLCPRPAEAIPAFTREFKTECTTCHTIYPMLNEYGEAFYRNGFVYTEGNPQGGKGEGAAAGRNESIFLSGIPEVVPLSLMVSQALVADPDAEDTVDFSTRSVNLQAGGNFRRLAGFYLNYVLYAEGGYDPLRSTVPGRVDHDIREAYFVWRHAFDTPVNVKVGRFRPQLGLWKGVWRPTMTPPAPYAYRVGSSPFTVDSSEDALEINGIVGSRVFAAAGVADRNGQDNKEGYAHLSFRLGGADLLGREPEVDMDKEETLWDHLVLTVGGYGYFGRNATLSSVTAGVDNVNNFHRVGVDAEARYKRLAIRLMGVKGKDSNPDFQAGGEERRSEVAAAEAQYLLGSSAIAAFRYEYEDVEGRGVSRRYIPALAYTPLQNVRLIVEYKYDSSPELIQRLGQMSLTVSF